MWCFTDRQEAGRKLAENLATYADHDDVTVLALPRGGVPVAREVATALSAPLDVLVVRKLGVPGHKELAMGALASGGVRVINEGIVTSLRITPEKIALVAQEEAIELERREQAYRGNQPSLEVKGCTVILVDDGVATGATMRAAVSALRELSPARVVVAIPTAAKDAYEGLKEQADEVVCLATPEPYVAVGTWYQDFPQTSDEEVRHLLAPATTTPVQDVT